MARVRMEEKYILQSWEEVDAVLKEIAENEMEIEAITTDMNKEIHDIKEVAEDKSKKHQERIKVLSLYVQEFTERNRDEIKGKTKVLNHGSVGFRQSTKVVLSKVDQIIEKLKKYKMTDCINIKETVNKDVLRKYPTDDILKVGANLKIEDVFWYETDREELEDASK